VSAGVPETVDAVTADVPPLSGAGPRAGPFGEAGAAAPRIRPYNSPVTASGGAPASARRGLVRRVLGLFRPYRRWVALVTLAIVLSAGMGVANPLLLRVVFDRALFCRSGCPDLHLLGVLVAAMCCIPVVTSAIGVGQTLLTNRIGQRVMQDLRDSLYAHLQSMSLRFFTETRTGEIQSRIANDVGGVQTVVTETASSIMANVVIIVSTLVAMLIISWRLTMLSLLLLPFFAHLAHRVGGARRRVALETQRSKAEMSAITEETLSVSGILLAKVFDRRQSEIERFRRENRRLADLQVRQTMVGQGFFAVVQSFFSITPALIYLVAGISMAHGDTALSPGSLVAFTTLQTRLFYPIGMMLQVAVEVQASLALFARIFEYLDLPQEIVDRPGAHVLDPDSVRGEVRLRDVWFRYGAGDRAPAARDQDAPPVRVWALAGVSLDVAPGQLAAIVGPSGAGKTTISYLIPRLYDVERGAVEIDGVDVRDIGLSSLAEIVGMVTQETYLFHATVRENLLYARPGASQDEIEAAARAAHIHDRIVTFDGGYDTVVGERGYRMSGGEKQRLAIARVILKDPRVLILDEATSALDTTSERLVQSALQPLMRGRTTIAIAHRLSTILAADVIFVLDDGGVVEQGSHAELVRAGGLYARLHREQFQGGLVEARCSNGVVLAGGQMVTTPGDGC
jgi:ATP-binding cassette, subfamily B, bacterial